MSVHCNLVNQAHFIDSMSYREIIKFFEEHTDLRLNLFNLSNHYAKHVAEDEKQELIGYRKKDVKEE
jgi:hypothetical protein